MTLLIKPFRVSCVGFDSFVYYARSRQMALSEAWNSYRGLICDISFGDFLRIATAKAEAPHERFGEEIKVGGIPAYLVSYNRQYIQFVRPDSETIFNSHPLDVEPPEARRGTPYYQPEAA